MIASSSSGSNTSDHHHFSLFSLSLKKHFLSFQRKNWTIKSFHFLPLSIFNLDHHLSSLNRIRIHSSSHFYSLSQSYLFNLPPPPSLLFTLTSHSVSLHSSFLKIFSSVSSLDKLLKVLKFYLFLYHSLHLPFFMSSNFVHEISMNKASDFYSSGRNWMEKRGTKKLERMEKERERVKIITKKRTSWLIAECSSRVERIRWFHDFHVLN